MIAYSSLRINFYKNFSFFLYDFFEAKKWPFSAVLCSKKQGPRKKEGREWVNWCSKLWHSTKSRLRLGPIRGRHSPWRSAFAKRKVDVDREKMQIIGPYSRLFIRFSTFLRLTNEYCFSREIDQKIVLSGQKGRWQKGMKS